MVTTLVMARFRNRGMALRPVHRIKHVVDQQGGITGGASQNIDLIKTVDAPVLANVTECETGSKVNGIYLHVEVYATGTATLANAYMFVFKNPGNKLTAPANNAVGASDIKKYIIHQEMVMLEKNTTGLPRVLFNGVIVIPKGYIRNGPSDRLKLVIFTPGVPIDFCIQCHYKEFR